MEIQEKISRACEILEKSLHGQRPAVLTSFGPRSMLLTHMLREWHTHEFEAIFFRHPFFPKKQHFAETTIARWDLTCHQNIAPSGSWIANGEVCYAYGQSDLNPQGIFGIKIDREEPRQHWPYLCGKADLLECHRGKTEWPWKNLITAVKDESEVQHRGDGILIFNPITSFSDEEVWALIDEYKVPVDDMVYESIGGVWKKKADRAFDPTQIAYCNLCFAGDVKVKCPKSGLMMDTILPRYLAPEFYKG